MKDAAPRKTRRRLSRYGCRTCKLRKVKCDEAQPCCQRCKAGGLACSFQAKAQLPAQFTERPRQAVAIARLHPFASNAAAWSQDVRSCFHLDAKDGQLFQHFRQHTLASLGGSEVVFVYENRLLSDSFQHPALMHGILALSAAHLRHLTTAPTSRGRCLKQRQHTVLSIASFRQCMNQRITESDKDTIWATAVALTTLAFASPDAAASESESDYRHAWPLKPEIEGAEDDLQWLRLKVKDKILWQAVDPMRASSIFSILSGLLGSTAEAASPEEGIGSIPRELAELYQLDAASSAENNAYYTFMQTLWAILQRPRSDVSFYQSFGAVGSVSDQLRLRIEQKDSKGLGLLYLWYRLIHTRRWWIDQRTSLEIPALHAYLSLHDEPLVRVLDAVLPPRGPAAVYLPP